MIVSTIFTKQSKVYVHTSPLFIDLVRDYSLGVDVHEIREEKGFITNLIIYHDTFTQHIYFDL